MVQNTLLGHYYTALHDFCQQYGYLIPTPEWTQVQTEFDDAFGAAKRDTERLSTVQRGKAVKQEFYSRPDTLQTRTMSHRTNSAGSSGMIAPLRSNGRLPPPVPAPGAGGATPPQIDLSTRPGVSSRAPSTAAGSTYGRPSPPMSTASFHTAATTRSDFFSTQPTSAGASAAASRRSASQPTSPYLGSGAASASSFGGGLANSPASLSPSAAAIAGKKKPPPPPPKRRPEPKAQQDWVVAQYDFAGEGEGDLSFREGDRIRVVVRTGSMNDWWEGECGGARGSFPANYCKAA
jgi:amphiphysin